VKFKGLILKFGFRSLEGVCREKVWRIPFLEEIKGVPSAWEHSFFWVADLPEKVEDRESHAMAYDVDKKKLVLVNKNFMEHAVVIVPQRSCRKCGEKI